MAWCLTIFIIAVQNVDWRSSEMHIAIDDALISRCISLKILTPTYAEAFRMVLLFFFLFYLSTANWRDVILRYVCITGYCTVRGLASKI